jgi:acyl-CoA dehydrogenase
MAGKQNTPGASGFGFNPTDELNDLRMSQKSMPLYEHVKRFVAETVDPMSKKYHELGAHRRERFSHAPGQLELLGEAKEKAKKEGLWNFFLPDAQSGEGLSNLDYAYLATELGKNDLASECLNCSAPDTGNMEVLKRKMAQAFAQR